MAQRVSFDVAGERRWDCVIVPSYREYFPGVELSCAVVAAASEVDAVRLMLFLSEVDKLFALLA